MNTKDLKSLLQVLRTNGVLQFESQDVKIVLSPEAMKLSKSKTRAEEDISTEAKGKYEDFPNDILSDEELTFYSAGGKPEDSPFGDDN